MKIEFNSLYWDNVDVNMLTAHKKVMKHFDIPMNYDNRNGYNHGQWMQWVINSSKSDICVFLEPDCIPLNNMLFEYIKYAYYNETFVGIAQVSNHIWPKTHVYAAPGFYAISKKAYDKLGRPSFTETSRSDTAEEICYLAEERGLKYRALLPTYFEKPSSEGVWRLNNLGYYGIGTVFNNSIYHLYQSRTAENVDLFTKRCFEVINGTFNSSRFIPSTTFTL